MTALFIVCTQLTIRSLQSSPHWFFIFYLVDHAQYQHVQPYAHQWPQPLAELRRADDKQPSLPVLRPLGCRPTRFHFLSSRQQFQRIQTLLSVAIMPPRCGPASG
jgi:hypothetical protein